MFPFFLSPSKPSPELLESLLSPRVNPPGDSLQVQGTPPAPMSPGEAGAAQRGSRGVRAASRARSRGRAGKDPRLGGFSHGSRAGGRSACTSQGFVPAGRLEDGGGMAKDLGAPGCNGGAPKPAQGRHRPAESTPQRQGTKYAPSPLLTFNIRRGQRSV